MAYDEDLANRLRELLADEDGVTEKRQQTLTVYKQAGTGFASLSAGLQFAPVPNFGINVAVRGSATFPVVTAVFSPELGVGVGF